MGNHGLRCTLRRFEELLFLIQDHGYHLLPGDSAEAGVVGGDDFCFSGREFEPKGEWDSKVDEGEGLLSHHIEAESESAGR